MDDFQSCMTFLLQQVKNSAFLQIIFRFMDCLWLILVSLCSFMETITVGIPVLSSVGPMTPNWSFSMQCWQLPGSRSSSVLLLFSIFPPLKPGKTVLLNNCQVKALVWPSWWWFLEWHGDSLFRLTSGFRIKKHQIFSQFSKVYTYYICKCCNISKHSYRYFTLSVCWKVRDFWQSHQISYFLWQLPFDFKKMFTG